MQDNDITPKILRALAAQRNRCDWRPVAIHESGHALAAMVQGFAVKKLSLHPDEADYCYCSYEDVPRWAHRAARAILAGGAAATAILDCPLDDDTRERLECRDRADMALAAGEELDTVWREALAHALELLQPVKPELRYLAGCLLRRGVLTGADVAELLELPADAIRKPTAISFFYADGAVEVKEL